MNASSWRKAADLVAQGTQANQQVQAAAMAESTQLESLPLSALSADDSGPPQVTYGTEQPLAASTPRATSTSIPETQITDTHRQIIPGMSEHLYPTLVADASLSTPAVDNCNSDNSNSDSHSYLDLAGINIILYGTRGQKQRHDENERANVNRRSALKDYTKPNTKAKIQRQKVPDDEDIDIDKIVKGDKPKDDRKSATKIEKQSKEK